jgi:pimeloyl-ACP methyl ester carboxylesterase
MSKLLLLLPVLFLLKACAPTKKENDCDESKKVELISDYEKIQFPSKDSLAITANLYHVADTAPVIVLCHQAGFNKFEYTGIAKKLKQAGYNCLAIDQRSGGGIVEELNETNIEAKKRNKGVDFLDAEQDIDAAVNFMSAKYKKPVILWGSSYSSVLVLYVAIDNANVKAVIAFSPGDYFQKEKGSLKTKLSNFSKPMLLTSSKEESKELSEMISGLQLNENQLQFIPDSTGYHGSRALWASSQNNEEYWNVITKFLEKVK